MSVVDAALTLNGSVHDTESLWYDTSRWQAWVDGLDRVVSVDGEWPTEGAAVTWESNPAGRGRVTERVVAYEQLVGQTVEVQDDSITGRQTITFTPLDGDAVEVELRLDYRIRRRSFVTPVIDLLFIRGAMRRSLRATLSRFAVEFGVLER
jgi:uncharacterized membrane protein